MKLRRIRWMGPLRYLEKLRDERGSLTAVIAIGTVAIFGLVAMATDVGRMTIAKQHVATVADAAALSGAQLLPQDPNGAVATVRQYLQKNGVDPQGVTVAMNPVDQTMSVIVEDDVEYTFARILGFTQGHVAAKAVARIQPLSGYNHVVPLSVVQTDWAMGEEVVLKESPGNGGNLSPGNYGALALGGNGASTYEENLAHGFDGWVRVGDWVTTKPGDVTGPTERAIQSRIDQDSAATFATVRKGSPRIVIVPILESFTPNGRGEVTVVGFGAFFLEGTGGQGNDRGTVRGRFMKQVVTGESARTGPDFATYTIKLTH